MVQNAGLGVGALLRQRREELGQDVDAVAGQLRIRPIYIAAIEDGRLQDLPGTAYAVGFVRTYADFLGFDGNRVVATYRDELAQRSRTEPVTWRMEERESHFPGGKLLIACLLLAGIGYGAWYYLSNTPSGVGLIEAVPEYLKKSGSAANSGSKAEEAKPAETAPAGASAGKASMDTASTAPATGEGTSAAAPQNPTAAAGGETAATTAAPATGGAASATGAAQNGPAAASQAGIVPGATAPSATAPAVTETPGSGSSQPAPGPTGAPTASVPAASVPAAGGAQQTETPSLQPASPNTPATAPQAEGSEAAPDVAAAAAASTTRISIRAKLESWVQILDKDGKPILSRVLRAGETYTVPDERGLVMSTGNAGGIEMVLDGKPLQSLGSVGLVRRNIVLDPEKLASGAAFLKTPAPAAPTSNSSGGNTGD